jgi:hypothetical protein
VYFVEKVKQDELRPLGCSFAESANARYFRRVAHSFGLARTSALLYATDRGRPAQLGVLEDMRRAPWADGVVSGEALGQFGFAAEGGVVAAVNMARQPEANPNGVPGKRWVAAEPGKPVPVGSGQHGGWGPDETRPFLMVNDGRNVGVRRQPSSLVDIAPTLVSFLGLPAKGFDGAGGRSGRHLQVSLRLRGMQPSTTGGPRRRCSISAKSAAG